MPAVPLPLVTAAILLYLVLRSRLRGERTGLVDVVLLLCAAQAVLVTLNLHVGLAWAARLQPFTAVLIPPACHLAWIALAHRPLRAADLARHAGGPLSVALSLGFAPQAIDVLVPALYAFYGGLLAWRLRGGADSVVLARLDGASLSLRLWRAIALALLGSASSDVLISVAIGLGRPELSVWIVTLFTSLALLGLGALSLLREETVGALAFEPEPHQRRPARNVVDGDPAAGSTPRRDDGQGERHDAITGSGTGGDGATVVEFTARDVVGTDREVRLDARDAADGRNDEGRGRRRNDTRGDVAASPGTATDVDIEEDRALVERARELLTTQALYRDPDLTLGRLARRLTVPAKRLSAAVNRVDERNVSQFVNRFRVEAVCRRLDEDGTRVTEAMLEAGFRTKSNFNREFRRVTGTSPTDWVRSRGDGPANERPAGERR